MLRGIYTSTSAMVAEFARQQALANDIANVRSNGYKRDDTFLRSFREIGVPLAGTNTLAPLAAIQGGMRAAGRLSAGVLIDEITPNLSQGELKETGRTLDLAIEGNGFFVVQDAGGLLYTRNGSFAYNREGFLTTTDGKLVMGKEGPIQTRGSSFVVLEDGRVLGNNALLGELRLVDFDSPKGLIKLDSGLFSAAGGALSRDAQGAVVKQGYLEQSNLSLVRGMVEVLSVVRSYQASQRLLRYQDETLRMAVGELGSVG
ncbi:MAG: flagellar hook-basal body protein [Chloroflexota bacterium]